jgi:hypothetical protein
VGVGPVGVGHLLNRGSEQILTVQDVSIFGKEQEDQPRHEVVHVGAAFRRSPFGIVGPQRRVELVQTQGSPHIELGLGQLFGLAQPCQRPEEHEVVGEVLVGGRNGIARHKVFGLKRNTVSRQQEADLVAFGLGRLALTQVRQRLWHVARVAGLEVDVVRLKDAIDVGFVRGPVPQFLYGASFVSKGFKERKRELSGVKRLFGQIGDSLFDFNCVQMPKSIKMRQACSVECLFWLKTLLHKFTSGYNLIIEINGPLSRSDQFGLPLNRNRATSTDCRDHAGMPDVL